MSLELGLRDPLATGRSVALGRNGMVCSASPLAAQVGLNVLKQGGNAFDAAVALAATEDVVLPSMCTLGAELFALLYQASTGKLYGITGSGKAPLAANRETFVNMGYKRMPREGALSCTLPGEVDALWTIQKRFGSGRFSFSQLLEPAIEYAEAGFPVPQRLSRFFGEEQEPMSKFPTAAGIFLNDGKPYQPGQVLVQKELARTLHRVADGGPDEFYRGQLGAELIKGLQEGGSLYTTEDLAAHETIVYEDPMSATYRGSTIYETRLPSQGTIVLMAMNILEGFDVASLGLNTADYIHLMVETRKLVWADRDRYFGDPAFVDVPLESLLSKEYAAQRGKLIDMSRANDAPTSGVVAATAAADNSTSFTCLADAEGNVVSLIHSIFTHFGSYFVAGNTGVLLNNRAIGFSLEEGHPNCIMPGKRPVHTLNCYMVFRDGKPYLTGGTPGGDTQPQWNMHTLTRVLDFGLDPQQAVESPRFFVAARGERGVVDHPYEIQMERPLLENQGLSRELESRGHALSPYGHTIRQGCVQLIMIDPDTGVLMGGSDPREDGCALGY